MIYLQALFAAFVGFMFIGGIVAAIIHWLEYWMKRGHEKIAIGGLLALLAVVIYLAALFYFMGAGDV